MSEVIRGPVTGRRPARTIGHRGRLNTPTSPTRHGLAACLSYIAMGVVFVAFMLPLLWLFFAAFDGEATFQTKIPRHWTLKNFAAIMTKDQTFLPLWNSFLISAVVTVIVLTCAVLCAYPLSRYRSKFNKPFLYTILFGTCLPITCLMVPVYSLFVMLHLLDSMTGTMLFLAASSLPMAIWMTKNFMDSVPVELEEAAWVDGASMLKSLRLVVVPLMKPGLAAVSIFILMGTWGNFFVPYILLLSPGKQPASVTIYSFFGQHGMIIYGQLAAFSLIYPLPMVIMYVIANRFLGTYSLAGGVKG